MSRLGFKSLVYHGDLFLGELDAIPVKDQSFQFPNNEIRVHHISPISERCPPLSILHTISSFSVRCKLESSSPIQQPNLINLHASCFHELKTAVVLIGDEELHLVAMPSKQKKFPCFWCYSVPCGLYSSSLWMLNLRCLAIVFDLDETLIVANTMKSFEDRIDALRGWIARESDQVRISGMSAELKRYIDDRALLKQYTENDLVMDNGKILKVQSEEVAPLSDSHERVVRPVIRFPERNIVLTRINPEIRDTSVLVRLRPAWEDLRSYLIAKGRKRFEVYVCTMAERDYALEMWRLLDPEAHLIGSKQLLDRVVCVKSGSRKSLLNVFQNGSCHPKMAMVIDDRLKVWEDKDQPRVHVVPPFTPYYAPQAETTNPVPILCVARNVACNVRAGFFKEFDENILRQISELFYEDEVVNLPSAPDVSNYLMSEDAGFVPNGNANVPIAEGMHGAEVERRLNQPDEKHIVDSAASPIANSYEFRSETLQPPALTVQNVVGPTSSRLLMPSQKPSLLGAPIKRDFSSFESDADMKRRLLIMKHGQDVRNQSLGDPPILSRLPQISTSSLHPQGVWLVEDDSNRGHLNNRASGLVQEADVLKPDKQRGHQIPFGHNTPGSTPVSLLPHLPQLKNDEVSAANEWQKKNLPPASQPSVQLQYLSWTFMWFEAISGLKVNLSKSEAIPVGECPPMESLVSILGCKIGCLPTSYLGLPLGAPYKSTSAWDAVEERFRKRLSLWKRQYLSKGGRLTLLKSTLSSLPTYFLSLFVIPKRVCARLEKIQRDFLWGGGALENKPHLVCWKVICAAKKDGGLGIRNLAIFNKALLGKWLWRFANENDSLWKQIISSKYDLQDGGWCSKGGRDRYGVGVWKAIRNGWEDFRSHSRFLIGDGTRVKFWKDLWCENQSLEEAFPILFNLSVNKEGLVAEAWEEDGAGGSWGPRFNRHLNDWEVGEVENLLSKLHPLAIRRGVDDSLRWKANKNGTFSVKCFYSSLSMGINHPFPVSTIWKSWAPTRASFFGWEAAWNRLLTTDRIKRFGWNIPNRCFLCKNEEESIDHLLLFCEKARMLWYLTFSLFGVQWVMHSSVKRNLLGWYGSFVGKKREKAWKTAPLCLMWTIWKERNRRAFDDVERNDQDIKSIFLYTFVNWARVYIKDHTLSLFDFVNWLVTK